MSIKATATRRDGWTELKLDSVEGLQLLRNLILRSMIARVLG